MAGVPFETVLQMENTIENITSRPLRTSTPLLKYPRQWVFNLFNGRLSKDGTKQVFSFNLGALLLLFLWTTFSAVNLVVLQVAGREEVAVQTIFAVLAWLLFFVPLLAVALYGVRLLSSTGRGWVQRRQVDSKVRIVRMLVVFVTLVLGYAAVLESFWAVDPASFSELPASTGAFEVYARMAGTSMMVCAGVGFGPQVAQAWYVVLLTGLYSLLCLFAIVFVLSAVLDSVLSRTADVLKNTAEEAVRKSVESNRANQQVPQQIEPVQRDSVSSQDSDQTGAMRPHVAASGSPLEIVSPDNSSKTPTENTGMKFLQDGSASLGARIPSFGESPYYWSQQQQIRNRTHPHSTQQAHLHRSTASTSETQPLLDFHV